VSAQRRAAAVLDGRHDLELAETEVTVLLAPPCRPVGAEDIRDLQAWHESVLRRSGTVQGIDELAQRCGGHVGIEGRGLEPMACGP